MTVDVVRGGGGGEGSCKRLETKLDPTKTNSGSPFPLILCL